MEDEKENLFFEPHKRGLMKTPLKASTAVNLPLPESQPDFGPLTTPTKPKEIAHGEPWTPTANLKMLISAASPEIRSRDEKRGLFDNRNELPEAKDSLHEHLSGDEYEKSQPSRKEKSLGLLCVKFLERYPEYPNLALNNDICLDEVAGDLKVERRRIYDIVNVLESLHMVSRLAKNRYTWHGRHNLNQTLQALKSTAEKNRYAKQIMMIKKKEYEQEFDFTKGCSIEDHIVKDDTDQNGQPDVCFVELPGMEFRAASVNSRKEKSLRVMSQKFVMLFLVSTPQIVSLEIAAKILNGEDHVEDLNKSKFKTKIRRLYDIANVLRSLDLIKKVHVTEERGRKPAFKWIGPEISPNPSDLEVEKSMIKVPADSVSGCSPVITFTSSDLEVRRSSKENCAKNLFSTCGKPNFTRHQSLIKLVKSIESDRRKINSAPSSPVKTNKAESSQNSAPFQSKMADPTAICKMQLEEQSSEPRNKVKVQLARSGPCKPVAPLDTPVNAELELMASSLTQSLGVVPLLPSPLSSAVPVILPQAPSGPPYAIYLQPAHAQSMTPPQGLSPTVCSTPSSKATRSKDPADATTEKAAKDTAKPSASTRPGSLLPVPERQGTKNRDREPARERGSKRASVFEDSASKKKFKEDLKGLENVSATLFPSGYLIPLAQCPSLGAESILSSTENSGTVSPNHRIYSSPIAGVIPVTSSELTGVNFPSFPVTSFKLMVSPTPVAAVPVGSSTALTSSHAIPVQNPSSAIVNLTLQHLGLIPPGVQVSASPGPGTVPVSPRIEAVSVAPDSTGTQQGRATRYDSPVPGHNQPNGQSVAVTGAQQPVPVTPKGSQLVVESFFRTPGGPTKPTGSACTDSDGASKTSVGTLFVPQRKLEVSTEDAH
ncbi:transcription factor E2F8 isoform X1 [Equus caballus]|uniref:Transcription factor E2F8 n=1 Tax=Equus caballus TaxID=9796 RepID=A0A9L0SW48_HORSE|nr:transcription factor E2F8 isoform X1 [Equus caballus]XP_005612273.1 transcription factor E2F8 isoform X1 [Equus caballus]XP_014597353.1 transcription factor E2F8 isoform X1 [Equus caballus]XP_023490320.1 transcription factor E2F8 isoform X1 [Equus caballus]XP_023490523.1 transcription factor E2F8-like isoform X1 [Equus caballus]XP_023490524.1 transcription factor E2F8-like isoform X1 [Equus caballus]XP_023490525.1 transcription factor E2F8-like isoform X1 [Equus caballus]XP_023490526.1 tr